MNAKRKKTKVVRVTEELLDSVAEIAAEYHVAKRDVIDALLEDFLYNDKKDPHRKFRVFHTFMSRYNLRKKKPPASTEAEAGGDERDLPSVPDWMK